MIDAKNKSEFLKVLSVISEEAVRLSRKSLNENSDPYVKKYAEQFTSDQKKYGSLSEQDEEGLEDLPPLDDEEGGGEEAPAEDVPDEDVELEDEPEEEPAEDDAGEEDTSTEEFGVSFDSVLDAINNLRAGKSSKQTNIKDQTSAYYDRLDDPERKVLLVFLKQLSEILGGAVDGSEAKDPSDVNLTVTDAAAEEGDEEADADAGDEAGGEEGDEEVITDEEGGDEGGEEELPPLEDEEEGEATEEDTSPPIKVNESQDLTELRKRIKRLMLRG